MRRRLHRAGIGVCAVLLAAILAGCQVGIPRSGTVYPGQGVDPETEESLIFNPARPVPGASQEDIVIGFIAAASSATSDYAIAREFLAPGLSTTWNPHAGVVIDSGQRPVTPEGDSVRMTLNAVASVDEHGTMRAAGMGGAIQLHFELQRVLGEWRISVAEDGIVLDEDMFPSVFNEHSLYFLAPQSRVLVPDQRWFLRGATTATRIVTELLEGPSVLLREGVTTTAFPEGTVLAASSVPVVSGLAQVDLSPEALTAETPALRMMLAQIETSLSRVAGVTRASLSVDQSVLLSGPADPSWAERYPRVPSKPIVVSDGTFGELGTQRITPFGKLSNIVVDASARGITVSRDQATVVYVTPEGVFFATNTAATLADSRPGLIDPTLDGYGFVWSVPHGQPRALRVKNQAGVTAVPPAPWLDAVSIEKLRISRDGTRLVALYDRGDDYVLAVSGVIRGAGGIPTAFTEPVELAVFTERPVDVDWIDESQIALATSSSGSASVEVLSVGGRSENLGPASSIESIAGGNSISQLRVLDSDGVLREYRGSSWQEVAVDITALAKRG
ncbi:LpqB family beta-propeller domain-containing protein [Klugiella xanthotipulae]|uniref:Sporulation and spore germination protein n=1 Tax=Klugiella xanthotipulae TaxID=244735 RepID=A0A543I4Y9_9MICO|nr:LpqB family beta-propeller domain-containing protein [Klugiella xanthotipulae]TQM65655.1 sporulation and spore germination protein [Klugiella xanthotipulae]